MRSVVVTALAVVAIILLVKWGRVRDRERAAETEAAAAAAAAAAVAATGAAAAPPVAPVAQTAPAPARQADVAGIVTGVVSFQDGQPAADIFVTASVRGGVVARTRTAPGGDYRLTPLPAGAVQVMASRNDRVQQFSWEGGGGPTWRNLALTPGQFLTGVDFALERGQGRIAGVVVLPGGGPAPNLSVAAQRESAAAALDACAPGGLADATTRTEQDGSFLLSDLPTGNYLVGVDDERSTFAVARHVPLGERALKLQLGRGGLIGGVVTRSDGAPAPGFRVTFTAAEAASPDLRDRMRFCWRHASGRGTFGPDTFVSLSQNDAGGRFELWGVGAGLYDLSFTSPTGERADLRSVALGDGEQRTDLEIKLQAGGGVAVRGQVRTADGAALPGAWVYSFDAQGPGAALTDSSGRFEAQGARAEASFTLRIRSERPRGEAQRRVQVAPGASQVDVGEIRLGL